MNIKQLIVASLILLFLQGCSFPQGYSVPPLTGYVYDQDGKPLADADVELRVYKDDSSRILDGITMLIYRVPYSVGPPPTMKIYKSKTNNTGRYQTKGFSFITNAYSIDISLNIDKYEYNAITTKTINNCYLLINRSIPNMDFESGGRFNIKSGLLYDGYKDKYGTYLQRSVKDNCYIARDWNISLSGHYDDKHPLLLPDFTLFNYDKLEKGINYEN